MKCGRSCSRRCMDLATYTQVLQCGTGIPGRTCSFYKLLSRATSEHVLHNFYDMAMFYILRFGNFYSFSDPSSTTTSTGEQVLRRLLLICVVNSPVEVAISTQ
eukprot:scaffold373_cov78-Skeletonema_dohrnii-CCMP3373.AAC.2